jgi:hypothetical protein
MLIQTANLAFSQPIAEERPIVVQAPVDMQPTPTPVTAEIPVIVQVTYIVPLPQQVAPALLAEVQLAPTQTPVPLLHLTLLDKAGVAHVTSALDIAPPVVAPAVTEAQPAAVGVAAAALQAAGSSCGVTAGGDYSLIPMEATDTNHPDRQHGDLNLAVRGTQPSSAAGEFVTYNGAVDTGAPYLPGLFADHRRGPITSVHQVRDWRWDCGEHGCAGDWLMKYEVTLLGIATTPGEAIRIPEREAEIYGGGYIAVVLYAEERRLTIAYTRDGTVANGYAAHLENFCVDPNLLAQYRAGNAGGRHQLPGLHNGQTVGVAAGRELLVAIRDRGMFMDPRSQKDWWR